MASIVAVDATACHVAWSAASDGLSDASVETNVL